MFKIQVFISFLLSSTLFLFASGGTGEVWTETLCANECPNKAVKLADNFRAIGNKADRGFEGWQDSWASGGANVFAANILATKATGWPRISEGCTYPLVGPNKTPGYPISVSAITKSSATKRYITFNAKWSGRTSGPKPAGMNSYPSPRGGLQHGAYLWFNDPQDPSKWNPYPTPKWPFSLEVNVWNRVDGTGFRAGATRFADYYDNDGKYEVRGHDVCHKGDCFYAYYVTLVAPKRSRNNVNINMNTLIRHLRDRTWNGKTPPALKSYYELIETSIAAEVRAPADAKFTANIATMGR